MRAAQQMERAAAAQAVGFPFDAQPKVYRTYCDLCRNHDFSLVSLTDRYGFDAPLWQCAHCELLFLSPHMTPEAYGEFYRDWYRPIVSAYCDHEFDRKYLEWSQGVYADRLEHVAGARIEACQGGSFLEIGGSVGLLADKLSDAWDLSAVVVEPSPDESAICRARGIETHTAMFEDWDAGGRQFDVIGIFQTIEHFQSISAALLKARDLLAPGGLLLVDVALVQHKIDHLFAVEPNTLAWFLSCELGLSIQLQSRAVSTQLFLAQKDLPCDISPPS